MIAIHKLDRRRFLASSAALAAAGCLPWTESEAFAAEQEPPGNSFCAFVKFVQSLSYSELADRIVDIGFDGIEATIRRGGQIPPERVEDELPKLVEELAIRKLEISVMASDVNRADDPLMVKTLRTAAKLGVKRYRMGGYRYDLSRPVGKQLDELKPVVKDLAALNRELGITAVYQNHSGATNVGAPVWDLHELLRDIPATEVGVAFDIRHATVEGGLAWPLHFNRMQPHLGAVYVKDFVWKGRRPENVPLGEGQVDPAFFKRLKQSKFTGPISVHVEYLRNEGVEVNLAALKRDLVTLKGLLA